MNAIIIANSKLNPPIYPDCMKHELSSQTCLARALQLNMTVVMLFHEFFAQLAALPLVTLRFGSASRELRLLLQQTPA